jgi:hypothetical protein
VKECEGIQGADDDNAHWWHGVNLHSCHGTLAAVHAGDALGRKLSGNPAFIGPPRIGVHVTASTVAQRQQELPTAAVVIRRNSKKSGKVQETAIIKA